MDALLKLVAVINAPLMVKFSSVPGQIFLPGVEYY